MEKHKMAGKPVKIENGTLKGRYFKVIDYFVNQYQGKDIKKLAKTKQSLLSPPVEVRKQPLDDKMVFGILLGEGSTHGEYACVHDNELIILSKSEEKRLSIVTEEKEDGTEQTSGGDNSPTQPGEPESEGRSVPSTESDPKPKRSTKNKG